jgi:hypothetical protein
MGQDNAYSRWLIANDVFLEFPRNSIFLAWSISEMKKKIGNDSHWLSFRSLGLNETYIKKRTCLNAYYTPIMLLFSFLKSFHFRCSVIISKGLIDLPITWTIICFCCFYSNWYIYSDLIFSTEVKILHVLCLYFAFLLQIISNSVLLSSNNKHKML